MIRGRPAIFAKTWLPMMLRHQPWPKFPTAASRLDPSQPIEEDQSPHYRPDRFYHVKLAQVLQERYQMVAKLGHGSGSTVWLARDLHRLRWKMDKYVAVKIAAACQSSSRSAVEDELSILDRISKGNPDHPGRDFVRKLVDSFTISDDIGNHSCLVFEPLREPLWLYRRRFVGDVIPPGILKILLQMILQGLDYLHSECKVIHTDLKTDNIMIRFEDPAMLEEIARDEYENSLPQKHLDDGRIIYQSRADYGPLRKPTGIIEITDFDHSTVGDDTPRSGCIQADVYRAPESILDAGYTYSADIWNLGVILWDLLEGDWLFKGATKSTQDYDEQLQLAYMAALLGPKPMHFPIGKRTALFYDPDGALRSPETNPGNFTFQDSITSMRGKDKAMFIEFAKRMIKWCPEERSTAKELLEDPWLYTSSED